MPNIKSAVKRVKTSDESYVLNQAFKSDMRTAIKRVEKLVASKDVENAKSMLPIAVKKIDKAIQRGALHKNNGARQKSRLTQKVNAL
ncbi:30S ribosomal protein S20 [Thalassobacillus sp. CUG 92003]|uniref:30S ribosomal protein S20 n=1 Tax=Thalassobacillus sp. CUG 92003 TaxID=2736641 RepID=UPI0015E6DFF7|nr:30S ribosomal protein S20 [Thalassobacillus sp. CUG 92003]